MNELAMLLTPTAALVLAAATVAAFLSRWRTRAETPAAEMETGATAEAEVAEWMPPTRQWVRSGEEWLPPTRPWQRTRPQPGSRAAPRPRLPAKRPSPPPLPADAFRARAKRPPPLPAAARRVRAMGSSPPPIPADAALDPTRPSAERCPFAVATALYPRSVSVARLFARAILGEAATREISVDVTEDSGELTICERPSPVSESPRGARLRSAR